MTDSSTQTVSSPSSTENSANPEQWLVRTSQNLIHGPYSKPEICAFIQEGKLTTLDEVCSATGYWFFLHEVAEVNRQLGVSPPLPIHSTDDEVTETEVHAQTHLSSLAETEEQARMESEAAERSGEPSFAENAESPPAATRTLPPSERDVEAAEAVKRAFQRSQKIEDGETIDWLKRLERLSFWKTLTIFLVIVTAVLFVSIIRLIRE